MRRSYIDIDGRRYLAVFSGSVAAAIEEDKGKPVQTYLSEVASGDAVQMGELIYLASLMIRAGDRYAKKNGIPNSPIAELDLDNLGDSLDVMDDLPKVTRAIMEIVTGTRNVLAKDAPKNAEGAPGDAAQSA